MIEGENMNSDKIILDLCGGTGAWSRPYKEAGYDVRLITLPEYDVCTYQPPENVYGILAAPPCTMFSDARTKAKMPRDLKAGMQVVEACLKLVWECMYKTKNDQQKLSPLKFWALENPWYGRLRWFLGEPCFVFDPWEFGDGYKKKTALWGRFNLLVKTVLQVPDTEEIRKCYTNSRNLKKFDQLYMSEIVALKGVNNADYWKNTKLRQTLRAITPAGFAEAFFKANQ